MKRRRKRNVKTDGGRRGGRDARSSIVTRGFELAKGVERGAERERGGALSRFVGDG